MKKKWFILGLTGIITLGLLSACGKKEEDASILKVGATPVPHSELLTFIKPALEKEGVTLEIVEFTDYVTPNLALRDGEIHANFFQHVPYMDSFSKEHGLDLLSLAKIHVEPLGLYSKSITSIETINEGAVIAIPNDPTNEGRSLLLLESYGLIKLSETAGLTATSKDITDNPLGLIFKPIDAAQLPRTLDDVDASVINTNYALEAGLNPLTDALILENADSPYANIITVLPDQAQNEAILKLVKVLQTDEVKAFIEKTYQGAVVPAF